MGRKLEKNPELKTLNHLMIASVVERESILYVGNQPPLVREGSLILWPVDQATVQIHHTEQCFVDVVFYRHGVTL